MSKTDTWMPLYTADYLADTMHLNTAQHGAYLLLLMHHWRVGPIPDDDAQLAAIARCDVATWRKSYASVIRPFFTITSEGLTQKRLMAERGFAEDLTDKRSIAGAAGAAKRWGKNRKKDTASGGGSDGNGTGDSDGKSIASAMANAMANECQNISQIDTPSPTPSKKETEATPLASAPPPVAPSLWAEGLVSLRRMTGKSDGSCRAQIGKWRKALREDDAALFGVIHEAETLNLADPMAWLERAVLQRSGSKPFGARPSNLAWMVKESLVVDEPFTIDMTLGRTH